MSKRNSLSKIDLSPITGGEDAAGSIDLKTALAAVLGGDVAGSIM